MSYKLTKGPKFALQRKRAATDLTHDMLQRSVTTSLLPTRILQYLYIHSALLSCHPWILPALIALHTLCCLQTSLGQTVVQPHQVCPSTYRHLFRDNLMPRPIHNLAPVTRELSAAAFAQTGFVPCQIQQDQNMPDWPSDCCSMP